MKRVKTAQNWYGTPEVTVHGSKKDPVPCVGEIVMLTGGVKARVERLSTISSKIDAFHGDHVWTAQAYLNFAI